MTTARRSSIDIIGEILQLGEVRKTRVMYQVNMSHTQLESYLSFLIDRGLLEARKEGNRTRYAPTPEGRALVEHIKKVQEIMLTEVPVS